MKLTRSAALALGLAVALALPAAAATSETQQGITVTGSATIRVAPKIAEVSFGVVTPEKTAAAALSENSARMKKVIAFLKAAGIAPADLRTEQVSISAVTQGERNVVIGYSASNTVRATVRNLGKLGTILDGAVSSGANNVYGPSFSLGNAAAVYRQALAAAFENAEAKAQVLAARAKVTLGRATSILEGSSGPPVFALAEASADKGVAVPIEPGRLEVEAAVTITFAIT